MISESQSAFQSSKAITDNILIAFETLHHMKAQKSKRMGFMAMKLDMSNMIGWNGSIWRGLWRKWDFVKNGSP